MQKIITDRLRPAGTSDSFGVEDAKSQLLTAYRLIDRQMEAREWVVGDAFTMADCAAAPALFYANMASPFGPDHGNVAAYLDRLLRRPCFARVMVEAQPFLAMVPG
jgi:glutathione S-transferase